MKLKIKVKRLNKHFSIPSIIKKGEWIDLRCSETTTLNAPQADILKRHSANGIEKSYRNVTFDSKLIGLGVAMQLPKGFEAHILPRSSTYKYYGVTLCNSQGIIDESFKGNEDEWKFGAIAFRNTTINEGDRICQFRIQLSQKANIWQKLKWLFSSGIKLIEVDNLNNPNRNGIGSTGCK